MATISNIANKIPCGGAAEANTGKLGCLSLFGTPTHLLALRKGTTILSSDTFDIAYLKPLVQNGTVIPLINASAFEDVSGEDTYSTNTSGVKRLNLKGLPEYKLMFEEGHEFYRQLAKLEGYKNFDYIIGDEEGNWLLATKSDGNYQGFTAGHTTPELTKRKVAGGDAEMKSLLVQFTLRSQWDENYAILHQDELDFLPEEVPAINGVALAWTGTAPAIGATITVSATLLSDNSSWVEGLDQVVPSAGQDWYVTVDPLGAGSPAEDAVTDVQEDTAGNYTLTITSTLVATDIVTVDVYDQANSVDVADVSGVLYRSATLTGTV